MLELVEEGAGGPLTGLNRGRYLLVELPPDASLRAAERVFHELSLLEVTAVVAHPERHALFRREPEALARLVRGGAAAQLTAGSLLGDFGERSRATANVLLELGLVTLVASDAHNLDRRPPRLGSARAHVRRVWGSEAEAGLFDENPRAVLESKPLPWAPVRPRTSLAGGA
jgi:protein-tyrosine phosphatase